jgi:hypothetical protein
MSEHVLNSLNAYYDGELSPNQMRRVERHLAQCSTCREAYDDIVATSAWLHNIPAPQMAPAEKMAADIALLLPREQEKPRSQSSTSTIWWIVPIVLFLIWVLVGSTHFVSNLLLTANDFGLITIDPALFTGQSINQLIFSTFIENLSKLLPKDLSWMIDTQDFLRENVVRSVIYISIAMLYMSWIAIWWANQNRQRNGQSLQK